MLTLCVLTKWWPPARPFALAPLPHTAPTRPCPPTPAPTQVDVSLDEAYQYDVDVKSVAKEGEEERKPPKGAVVRPMPAEVSRWGGG